MKKKKKKKIKIKSFLIILLVILVIGLLIYGYARIHIQNIYVVGNNILTEQEIIEEAGLQNYPTIYSVSKVEIENKLKKNSLIKEINVSKSLFGKITITIKENRILYKENESYMLSSGKLISFIDEKLGIPTLINEIDEKVIDKFIQKLDIVDDNTLSKISEIKYVPSSLDNERFMFYMNDGNSVYITLNKMEVINNYNEIYPTLEGNKGILYLDSGNHFEIKIKNGS